MTRSIASQIHSFCENIQKNGIKDVEKLCEFLTTSQSHTEAVSQIDFNLIQTSVKKAFKNIGAEELLVKLESLNFPADLAAWLVSSSSNPADVAEALASKASAQINVLRFRKRKLEIDFQVSLINQLSDFPAKVVLLVGDSEISLQQTGEEAGHYIYDQQFAQSAYFSALIPEEALGQVGSIKVALTDSQGKSRILNLTYRPASHLVNMRFQSWTQNGLTFRGRKKSITFEKAFFYKRLIREILFILEMTRINIKVSGLKSAAAFLLVRICYWMSYPILNKQEIWITHDKMYSALDSGEYFYWYMHNNARGKIRPFYAINKDAKDVPRLKKQGANLLHPLTLKHFLYYLHADVYVTTASSSDVYNGITGRASQRYRDLIDGRLICIQHGLIIQGVYKTMHRGRAGIERIYCASNVEVENLTNPRFGYQKSQLPKAGFTRFDGLIDERSKTFMLSPTWRSELTGKSVGVANPRKASETFTKSEFFKTYADVLIDRKLLQKAKDSGFKLQFVLHPLLAGSAEISRKALSALAKTKGVTDLYDSVVSVIGAGIEQSFDSLIRQSGGLVTDYSGIQFDVAYMRKPVLYLHAGNVPPQYDNGPMDYGKDGFGPITTTPEELRAALIREFRPETSSYSKYARRVDKFFENVDSANCERVFNDAYEFTRP